MQIGHGIVPTENIPPPPLILAATDFSETAAGAVQWAAGLAREHHARLVVMHALSPYLLTPTMAGVEPVAPGIEAGPAEQSLQVQDQMRQKLEATVEAIRQTGVDASSYTAIGTAKTAIVETAKELGARLIVVGSRGHTRFERLLLGSVAAHVVRGATCPTLTIHPRDAELHREIRTILVPTDFSADAQIAAETASRVLRSRKEDSKLCLLHVQDPPIELTALGPMGEPIQQMSDTVEDGSGKLREIATALESEGYRVETLMRKGYPVEIIEETAREIGADLIAMGTHGRSGLERLLLGSVAERVVQHAPCPVLTVRSPDGPMPGR